MKKFSAYFESFFVLLSLKTTRNNRSSPHNGPIKKIFPKNLIMYAQLTMK